MTRFFVAADNCSSVLASSANESLSAPPWVPRYKNIHVQIHALLYLPTSMWVAVFVPPHI